MINLGQVGGPVFFIGTSTILRGQFVLEDREREAERERGDNEGDREIAKGDKI